MNNSSRLCSEELCKWSYLLDKVCGKTRVPVHNSRQSSTPSAVTAYPGSFAFKRPPRPLFRVQHEESACVIQLDAITTASVAQLAILSSNPS